MSDKLIVVDVINDFCAEGGALAGPECIGVVPAIVELVREHLDAGRPVYATCDAHTDDDPEFDFFPPHAKKGEWGSAIVKELEEFLANPNFHVIEKETFNAFYNTTLEDYFTKDDVVGLCGVATHICVMDTAAGLFYRKIPTELYMKAIADFDMHQEPMAIKRMAQVYGAKLID
jgi:nicotinamidase-related amidase